MQNTETLLKAALNRISARLGEKVIDVAAEIALLAKDAPDQLKKEWDILKDEIIEEAERLEKQENNHNSNNNFSHQQSSLEKPLEKIDRIRAKLTHLNEVINYKD
tara:strand:+ start:720 stop:1034 length:315 start_codon:yes stop_codon:yes gene_type:complete